MDTHNHHHHQNLATEKKSFETKHGTTTTTSVQGIKEVKSLSSSSSLPANNSSKKQVTISSSSSSPASPPSASSSPSHEFSFTISLSTNNNKATTTTPTTTNNNNSSSFAVDLSPADDIFFHGHLLPLHLLSHLPVSPRSSTNSMDSFTLPIKEISSSSSSSIMEDIHQKQSKNGSSTATATNGGVSAGQNGEAAARSKPNKSFSLFGLSKWRKGQFRGRDYNNDGSGINNNSSIDEDDDIDDYYGKEKGPKRSKVRFELSHVIKRYMRMVRPLLFSRARRESIQLRRQPHSFSGVLGSSNNSNNISKRELMRGRRGEYSAPASMWTSPSNSGLLVATATASTAATSDSSMEELQAAIQAAIAHCKNSISNNNNVTEDKVVKC